MWERPPLPVPGDRGRVGRVGAGRPLTPKQFRSAGRSLAKGTGGRHSGRPQATGGGWHAGCPTPPERAKISRIEVGQ